MPLSKSAILFDLDETLVLTSALEPLRKRRNWPRVYANFSQTELPPATLNFIAKVKALTGVEIGVVTKLEPDFYKFINDFIQSFVTYRQQQPFSLWAEKENEFRAASDAFALICRILATAEQFNFDKRADTLREVHPLSLQVHLESGVANGVLVVRSVDECAEVLHKLLTNSLDFLIEFDTKEGCTLLKEKISQSPFRAVSNYEKMANSFWNFYLLEDFRNQWRGGSTCLT